MVHKEGKLFSPRLDITKSFKDFDVTLQTKPQSSVPIIFFLSIQAAITMTHGMVD